MNKYKEVLLIVEKRQIARHNTLGYNFPFFTREPERPKYRDDFNEIIGIIARISYGKQKDIVNIEDKYKENLLQNLDFDGLEDYIVLDMFKLNFEAINKPNMFLYYPVKDNKKSELKGKKILAEYITKLFKLNSNDDWIKLISAKKSNEVYDDFIRSSLPELEDNKEPDKKFNFFNQEKYLELFSNDLKSIMRNDLFLTKNISLFISYYYFYYIIQETYNLARTKRQEFKSYYAFDNEKVSGGRKVVKQGYSIIQKLSKKLLLNNDVLNYLNELIDEDKFYSISEIYEDLTLQQNLKRQLYYFNIGYSEIYGLDYTPSNDLNSLIEELRKMLEQKNTSPETSSRYRKSFDEFSNLSFIKRRGRYGYVFNASEDLIIMFVNIIIGDKDRILLRDLFKSFEKRGLYFDKTSQIKIVEYFERLNILDKLSDSGDAQYVRAIL